MTLLCAFMNPHYVRNNAPELVERTYPYVAMGNANTLADMRGNLHNKLNKNGQTIKTHEDGSRELCDARYDSSYG